MKPARRAFLLTLTAAALTAACGRQPPAQTTDALWSLTLPDTDGREQALAQWRGAPLLVNFWASWCAPCRKEMPMLAEMSRRFAPVQFVGIGLDSAEVVALWRKAQKTPYPLLVGKSAVLDEVAALGNEARALPFTLLLDAQGAVFRVWLGAVPPEALQAALQDVGAKP